MTTGTLVTASTAELMLFVATNCSKKLGAIHVVACMNNTNKTRYEYMFRLILVYVVDSASFSSIKNSGIYLVNL